MSRQPFKPAAPAALPRRTPASSLPAKQFHDGFQGNNVLHKNHFRKDWQRRVKTWFDQPGAKKRRRNADRPRLLLPVPTSLLRPAVRCQTVRYNRRIRSGRGFTAAELASAGIRRKEALTIGIPYDHRSSQQKNQPKADSTDLSAATTQDVSGPLPLPSGTKPEAARAITSENLNLALSEPFDKPVATQRQAGVWKARKQKKDEEDAAKKK
ncbi:hypothetical protein H4Q26_010128 [Puccinia striiformis f. sp. tritici PST-130]|nr:hypothetical protein H4Q26_010128 [Puccinia striiformis f. sp. tritici PST-130]